MEGTIDGKASERIRLPFLLIYCHIPHICHRVRNALYKVVSRDVWQCGSKFLKIKFLSREFLV